MTASAEKVMFRYSPNCGGAYPKSEQIVKRSC